MDLGPASGGMAASQPRLLPPTVPVTSPPPQAPPQKARLVVPPRAPPYFFPLSFLALNLSFGPLGAGLFFALPPPPAAAAVAAAAAAVSAADGGRGAPGAAAPPPTLRASVDRVPLFRARRPAISDSMRLWILVVSRRLAAAAAPPPPPGAPWPLPPPPFLLRGAGVFFLRLPLPPALPGRDFVSALAMPPSFCLAPCGMVTEGGRGDVPRVVRGMRGRSREGVKLAAARAGESSCQDRVERGEGWGESSG